MAIPKLKKQNIIDALKFIDENGVPEHNTSVKYVLVSENGKKYPPKYVMAVADHLANGTDISTEAFTSADAKNYLESRGFTIETKPQEKFELSITAESVESTDERFTMEDLNLGDNYKPLNAYFEKANGNIIKRAYNKGEKRNSNQTMPRIACQIFEKQLAALSVEDKESFPVCKYSPIIGTMNDIDRSVDSFDFAMRRRFRFVELRADEHLEAINESIEDEGRRLEAIRRMAALNKEIVSVEDLNENYQIGAAYFAKLKTLDFDQLWTDYLQPLLQEYIQGMYDEEGIMNRFARAYGYQKPARGDANEAAQDQG